GGTARRINTEEYADSRGDHLCKQNSGNRNVHGYGRRGGSETCDSVSDPDANGSAHRSHDRGFDQELQENVVVASAEGLTNANLAGPLRDGGKHHVHDDHAPDDQEDRDHADHSGGYYA